MRFVIRYDDPETGERQQVETEYEDTCGITARQWAEDEAYSLADKGWYSVTQRDR